MSFEVTNIDMKVQACWLGGELLGGSDDEEQQFLLSCL